MYLKVERDQSSSFRLSNFVHVLFLIVTVLSEAAWGVESEGFLLTVIALIFGTMLFAVPSVGLLFMGSGEGTLCQKYSWV